MGSKVVFVQVRVYLVYSTHCIMLRTTYVSDFNL